MESRPNSRIAAARARASAAKQVLAASAVALFLGGMLAARSTHAAHSSPTSSTPAPSSSSATDDSGFDDFDSGSLAPAQSVPQLSTGSS